MEGRARGSTNDRPHLDNVGHCRTGNGDDCTKMLTAAERREAPGKQREEGSQWQKTFGRSTHAARSRVLIDTEIPRFRWIAEDGRVGVARHVVPPGILGSVWISFGLAQTKIEVHKIHRATLKLEI